MTPTELILLKKDIDTARTIVQRALDQYRKKQLAAKRKNQLADLETFFSELDSYQNPEEIVELYGWGEISEAEKDRLLTMWDARENVRQNAGKYADRVTEMLETVIRRVGSEYDEEIYGLEIKEDDHGNQTEGH